MPDFRSENDEEKKLYEFSFAAPLLVPAILLTMPISNHYSIIAECDKSTFPALMNVFRQFGGVHNVYSTFIAKVSCSYDCSAYRRRQTFPLPIFDGNTASYLELASFCCSSSSICICTSFPNKIRLLEDGNAK